MILWTYAILFADGSMDHCFTEGPMAPEKLKELVGGEPEFLSFIDGSVAAYRKNGQGLPVNVHFVKQGGTLYGMVVLGKYDSQGNWLGMLGVQVPDRP